MSVPDESAGRVSESAPVGTELPPGKLQLLLWGREGEHADFGALLHGQVVPALLDSGVVQLKLSITEQAPPRWTVLPLRREPMALLSLWGAAEDDGAWRSIADATTLRWAAYRVQESTPLRYPRDWVDGQRSPGAVLLSLFRPRSGLSQQRFLDVWHGEHTPLALRIHPLWNYVRNVVDEPLSPQAPPFAGIVEEHFQQQGDILDPRRFFGGSDRPDALRGEVVRNMARVALHTRTFLDLGSVQNYLLREYHLRS